MSLFNKNVSVGKPAKITPSAKKIPARWNNLSTHRKIGESTQKLPRNFWTEQSNQREFFDALGKQIGIRSLDDWYGNLSKKLLLENGGRGFLSVFNNSASNALMSAYPEHNWVPWEFNIVNRGYWNDISNQRKFFDELGLKLGVEKLDDWYTKLSHDILVKNGGTSVVAKYKNSPMSALMAAYPEHNWIPWKFNNVPRSFWSDKANHRKYLDDLGHKLGIKTLDDWYEKLSLDLLLQNGGRGLLDPKYKHSAAWVLMAAYPEHKWVPWKFNWAPRGTWKSKEIIQGFLSELSEKLSIQTLDDWYRVDLLQLRKLGGLSIIYKYRGLYNLLKEQYPHHPWDPRRFQQSGKKAQRWLVVTLKKMFPNEEILEDYLHPKVKLATSNRLMQLDVFIPSKNVAFEYQGKQHYEEVGVFSPTRSYQRRDEEKRNLCAANNIKLIEVPYWWNRTQQELQAMIDKSLD